VGRNGENTATEQLRKEIEAADKALEYRSEYENKVGERQMSVFLTECQALSFRFLALYARSLVTVYVFYVSLRTINVVSAAMCVFALMDCALSGMFSAAAEEEEPPLVVDTSGMYHL